MPEHKNTKVDDAAEFRQAREKMTQDEKQENGNQLMADLYDLAKQLKADYGTKNFPVEFQDKKYDLELSGLMAGDKSADAASADKVSIRVKNEGKGIPIYDIRLNLNKKSGLWSADSCDYKPDGSYTWRKSANKSNQENTGNNFYGIDVMEELRFLNDIKVMMESAVQNKMLETNRKVAA